jgi:hypothetical protein
LFEKGINFQRFRDIRNHLIRNRLLTYMKLVLISKPYTPHLLVIDIS